VPSHLRPSANGYQKSAKSNSSGICEAFNPVQGPNNVGIAPEIIIARQNTENVATALVSDGALEAFREKSKLIFRRLFARPGGPPVNLRPAFATHPLFFF